ncbi:MAG TPA: PP2C family serine/threonine-protein phosphatase [Gammaproteobacteria bacterium]
MNAAASESLTEGVAMSLPSVKLSNGLNLASAAFSARGARDYNEDRLGIADGGKGYWALADGLGGHRGGARAAEIAVEAGLASLENSATPRLEDRLKQAVSEANARIRALQKVEAGNAQMRSTVVLLGIDADDMVWAHTGDSRLYHFRDGRLLWRTRDHSVVQLLVSAGEIAETDMTKHPERSRLISCLGGDNSLLISAKATGSPPRVGDVLLLASDGMWEHFEGWQLEATLARCSDPQAFLTLLATQVGEAMHPTQDNYTAIAVYVTAA